MAPDEQPVLVLCGQRPGRRDLLGAAAALAHAPGSTVHHLVDPAHRACRVVPGLAQVTVLHPDPAWAEVWSKTLFLAGAVEVAAQAEVRTLAAAWVTDDGAVHTSPRWTPT